MKPWIVFTGITLVLDIFSLLLILNLSLATDNSSLLGWVAFPWLPRVVLNAFFFFVVRSFKNEIEKEVGAGEDYQGDEGGNYKREEREMLNV